MLVGAELGVLKGGMKTIKAHRPFIYAEFDRPDKNKALISFLKTKLKYSCFLHKVPLFPGPKNFNDNPDDVFGPQLQSVNMLCIPDTPADDAPIVPKKLMKHPISLDMAGRPIDEL